MLTIYSIPESLYCAKLRILLRHKGLTWDELPPPGGYGSDAYKQVVPSGSLPAMVDGDLMLADSEAIAEYLNERHPTPPMLPDDIRERALVRQLARFHDTRLEPALRLLFPQMRPALRNAEAIDTAIDAIQTRLGQLVPLLTDAPGVATGGALTLGDCGYPVTLRWIARLSGVLGKPVAVPEPVARYEQALHEQPAVATEFGTYTASMDAWVAYVSTVSDAG